jgi:hypothetical protein
MSMRAGGKQSVNGQSTSALSSAFGDDTIELQLTPEQLLELSQPAELEEPVASGQVPAFAPPERTAPPERAFEFAPPPPLFKVARADPSRRWRHTPIAKMAVAIVAYTVLAWWSASQLSGQPKPPVTAAIRPPAAIIARPALTAGPALPTLRVVNPFDKTEVFEFPAGTSNLEGRQKVAQILMQRARDRQNQWEHIRPVPNIRTASLYPP